MKKVLSLVLICFGICIISITGSGCKNTKTSNSAQDAITTDAEASDGQISKEQIINRLEELFNNVVKGKINDYDAGCFSSEFNQIYNKVQEIDNLYAKEGCIGFWDFGFWDMAQEDVNLKIKVNDVFDIKDKEATAKVTFNRYNNEEVEYLKVIFENGKWVLDDLHGYKKKMKDFIEENKDYKHKISSASGEDYSGSTSSSGSRQRPFTDEADILARVYNQRFMHGNGLEIRVDGYGRIEIDGDPAGVLSVLRYNSESALLRYGNGMYGEGKILLKIDGSKLLLQDPVDGSIFYQR